MEGSDELPQRCAVLTAAGCSARRGHPIPTLLGGSVIKAAPISMCWEEEIVFNKRCEDSKKDPQFDRKQEGSETAGSFQQSPCFYKTQPCPHQGL